LHKNSRLHKNSTLCTKNTGRYRKGEAGLSTVQSPYAPNQSHISRTTAANRRNAASAHTKRSISSASPFVPKTNALSVGIVGGPAHRLGSTFLRRFFLLPPLSPPRRLSFRASSRISSSFQSVYKPRSLFVGRRCRVIHAVCVHLA
jgi:hypothetical protein